MRVLIVEDVSLVADYISDLAKKHLKDSKIKVAYTLQEAQFCITEEVFDLVFLDLNLNGKSGFQLLEYAVAASFQTIVITANREKAAIAFDYGVLDFISKPIIEERFKIAIHRFLNGQGSHREQLKYLTVKSKGLITLIKIEDIEYIQASGNYSEIHTTSNQRFLHDKNLEKLYKILPDHFIRTHRSYIVERTKIVKVIKLGGGKYELELASGKIASLSRRVYKELFINND